MEELAPVYQYQPIIATKEIRVLKLEPAASLVDPLITSLFVRKIHDADGPEFPMPTYHGVSYCWGTGQDQLWIQCNGQRLQITTNIDLMLRHLRKVLMPRYLWIDALCMNQSDDAEKAQQVKVMGSIYESAEKVHIWLGQAAIVDQIPSVFATLRRWALNMQQPAVMDMASISHSMVAPLNAFMARAWFTRRWVLQEVKLARAVTVHCGKHRLPWTWIRDGMGALLADYASHKDSYLQIGLIPAGAARALDGLGTLQHQTKETTTIFQLLWDHHSSICADHRDRIFALYGISRQNIQSSFDPFSPEPRFNTYIHCPVDYSKHFTSIYTQLAAAAVEEGHGLTIISHALVFGNLAQQNSKWPSWVPSWNMARKTQEKLSISAREMLFDNESNPASISRSQDRTMLRLDGEIHPISVVQDAGTAGNVMAFIKTTLQGSSSLSAQFMSGRVAAALLLRSIEISEGFYDRTKFRFATVFSGSYNNNERHSHHRSKYDCLLLALKREFHVPMSPEVESDLAYSPEVLQQEVDRMLLGHRMFRYDFRGTDVLGIAFADIEPGDYVFRPRGLRREHVSYTALVLRSHAPSLKEGRDLGAFRLVGCCVDYEPWAVESNIPSRRLGTYVRVI